MTVWYAGSQPTYDTVTNTRCRIDTVISPDDGHIVARNMYRTEINIQEKLCTRLVLFTILNKDARSTKLKKYIVQVYVGLHSLYYIII